MDNKTIIIDGLVRNFLIQKKRLVDFNPEKMKQPLYSRHAFFSPDTPHCVFFRQYRFARRARR